jgi:hypothetical protein
VLHRHCSYFVSDYVFLVYILQLSDAPIETASNRQLQSNSTIRIPADTRGLFTNVALPNALNDQFVSGLES